MAVNYHGKFFTTFAHVIYFNTMIIYHGTTVIYCGILTPENVGTVVNYYSIFITFAPDVFKDDFLSGWLEDNNYKFFSD